MQLNPKQIRKEKIKIVVILVLCATINSFNLYSEDDSINPENSSESQNTKPELIQDSNPQTSKEIQTPVTTDTTTPSIRPAQNLIALANQFYDKFTKGKKNKFPNENMSRMHKFAITYDVISREHFSRGVTRLSSQRQIPELIDYSLKGDWLEQITRMTSEPIYGYSENRALRIFVSTHTVAESYEIPYPTFFCLLFQESQFDFKVRSKTGATGLGQLTGIAIRQLQINRKSPSTEKRLQSTIAHLGNIYKDEAIKEILTEMGFKTQFPELNKFPSKIVGATMVNHKFAEEIARRLVRKGYNYGKDFNLVKKLTDQVSRGILLPKGYAAVHQIYLETLSQAKNHLGNTLNIETNILLSAMLLRYYMDYPWRVNGARLRLRPEVNAILAVAAYNQGPGGVQRYLTQFKLNFPKKDLNTMTLNDFRSTFTSARVANALKQTPGQAKEVFEHVWKVKLCSHDKITRPRR